MFIAERNNPLPGESGNIAEDTLRIKWLFFCENNVTSCLSLSPTELVSLTANPGGLVYVRRAEKIDLCSINVYCIGISFPYVSSFV